MDAPNQLPLNARTLEFRSDGYDCTLQFDEENLHYNWQSSVSSKRSKIPLRALKPEFPEQRWMAEGGRKTIILAQWLLVSAVVVYFSEIRTHVPLLAPALLLFCMQQIYILCRSLGPLTKTAIYSDKDDIIASIPHHAQQTSQRKAFEEALLRAIKIARGDDFLA